MACAGLSCRQGRSECQTPWTCGGYQNEAHHAAMTAPVGSFYPSDMAITFEGDEPADISPVTPESAMQHATRLFLLALGGAALFAVLYLVAWPQLLTWLAF